MTKALVALLFASWSYFPVTWGPNTQLVNGQKCVALNSDGGFFDAGISSDGGTFVFDAGIYDIDGGVCADGGTSCQACSGTCNIDAGWTTDAGVNDAGPVDGGWVAGASQSFTSDPITANFLASCECYTLAGSGVAFPYDVNINTILQLIGTPEWSPNVDGGHWFAYAGADGGLVALDGGTNSMAFIQGLPALFPNSAIDNVGPNNSDGGFLCCTCATQ